MPTRTTTRSEEHTSELQSHDNLVCRLLLEKKKKQHSADYRPRATRPRPDESPLKRRRARSCHVRLPTVFRVPQHSMADLICFFFFNDAAPPEIYPLSLHDAFPISDAPAAGLPAASEDRKDPRAAPPDGQGRDRKSTRLNSSHTIISYAVFCLKKNKTRDSQRPPTTTYHPVSTPP